MASQPQPLPDVTPEESTQDSAKSLTKLFQAALKERSPIPREVFLRNYGLGPNTNLTRKDLDQLEKLYQAVNTKAMGAILRLKEKEVLSAGKKKDPLARLAALNKVAKNASQVLVRFGDSTGPRQMTEFEAALDVKTSKLMEELTGVPNQEFPELVKKLEASGSGPGNEFRKQFHDPATQFPNGVPRFIQPPQPGTAPAAGQVRPPAPRTPSPPPRSGVSTIRGANGVAVQPSPQSSVAGRQGVSAPAPAAQASGQRTLASGQRTLASGQTLSPQVVALIQQRLAANPGLRVKRDPRTGQLMLEDPRTGQQEIVNPAAK